MTSLAQFPARFMVVLCGLTVMFLAGLPMWIFLAPAAAVAVAAPFVYQMLHGYQRKRIDTFLDPESDPLGTGYHIAQSKIAIGSGGIWGKGFLHGSQSHLDYLPEGHTDFVFATMSVRRPAAVHGQCCAGDRASARSAEEHRQRPKLIDFRKALVRLRCQKDVAHHLLTSYATCPGRVLDLILDQRRPDVTRTDRVAGNVVLGTLERHGLRQPDDAMLQLLDRASQRGLTNVALLGSASEVQRAGKRDEIADLLHFHRQRPQAARC